MPVRETVADHASGLLNEQIRNFNRELKELCGRNQAEFVDVTSVVSDGNGGLASELTPDGLHLNLEGYRKIAGVLAPELAKAE